MLSAWDHILTPSRHVNQHGMWLPTQWVVSDWKQITPGSCDLQWGYLASLWVEVLVQPSTGLKALRHGCMTDCLYSCAALPPHVHQRQSSQNPLNLHDRELLASHCPSILELLHPFGPKWLKCLDLQDMLLRQSVFLYVWKGEVWL